MATAKIKLFNHEGCLETFKASLGKPRARALARASFFFWMGPPPTCYRVYGLRLNQVQIWKLRFDLTTLVIKKFNFSAFDGLGRNLKGQEKDMASHFPDKARPMTA